jgi:predicted permease
VRGSAHPPRLASWIIASHVDPEERDEVLGDLMERFGRRAKALGWGRARRWYWREALSFFWHVGRHRARSAAERLEGSFEMSKPGHILSALVADLRYGIRRLAGRPAFTGVAILVLMLGIGANSAIFTLMNEILLRPADGEQLPGELVGLYSRDRVRADHYRLFSWPNYQDIRQQSDVFSHLIAQGVALTGVTEGDETKRAMTIAVSSNFFEALGAHLAMGRAFSAEEEQPGHPADVAVLSHAFWQSRGGRSDVLGSRVRINGRDYTVVGVAPRGFTGTSAVIAPALFVPLGCYHQITNDFMRDDGHRSLTDRESHVLLVAGRLNPGLSVEAANVRLEALGRSLEEAYPAANHDQTLLAHTMPRVSLSSSPGNGGEVFVFAVFGLLQAMALVVLLIACLNLANMMLAQASARRREIGIRLALGAGRLRIVRQLLVEGLVLATAGAAAGLALAYWVARAMAHSLTSALTITLEIDGRPDVRVVAATALFALVSTLAFASGPAWRLSRTDVVSELKQLAGEKTTGPRRWLTPRHALVVLQIALSLALLTGGGLFVQSARQAANADPGFEFKDGLVASLDPSLAGFDETRTREVYRRLLERVRGLPGVRAAGLASMVPFGEFTLDDRIQRLDLDAEAGRMSALSNVVTSDYFSALGLRVLRGRDFTAAEEQSPEGARVVIVDEPLARKLFPDVEPLGKQIVFLAKDDTPAGPPAEIVGIVPGLRHQPFDRAPAAHVYRPFGQRHRGAMTLHVKTAPGIESGAALASVRATIRAVDDRIPVLWLKSLEGYRESSLWLWMTRAGGLVFSTFGALALLLAAVGLYGVKAYLIGLRTREIGVRVALGATSRGVVWLLVRESMRLTALGVAIGLVLAVGVATAVSQLIYQPSPYEPGVFAGAVAVLTLASLGATWLAARRAARIEPFTALRTD